MLISFINSFCKNDGNPVVTTQALLHPSKERTSYSEQYSKQSEEHVNQLIITQVLLNPSEAIPIQNLTMTPIIIGFI